MGRDSSIAGTVVRSLWRGSLKVRTRRCSRGQHKCGVRFLAIGFTLKQVVSGTEARSICMVSLSPRYLNTEHAGRPSGLRLAMGGICSVIGGLGAVGAVVAAPWWFGSVQSAAQFWLLSASIVSLALCGLSLLLEPKSFRSLKIGGFRLAVVMLPLITALGLGFLQLVPLDSAVAAVVAPGTVALREQLVAEGTPSDQSLIARASLFEPTHAQQVSLCPAATRLELAWLTLVSVFFLVGAYWFSNGKAQVALWFVVAANGAAIAFFALVQKLSYNGMIFWTVPLSQGGSPFGPFVNRNNAAGYLNLCLACGFGLVLWAFQRSGFLGFRGKHSPTDPGTRITSLPSGSDRRFSSSVREFLLRLDGWSVISLVFASFMLAAVVVSLSRGGMVALALALLFLAATILASRRFSGRVVWTGIVVLAGLGLVGWVNATEAVRDRLATLMERTVFGEGRVRLWKDSLQAVPAFWRTGTGLGTYRYVYGLYQTEPASHWFQHAENQYVEWLVEGGVMGLGLWVGFLGMVGAASWRLLRSAADPMAPIAGMVGMFALATQATQACFDFGLRIPSNSILFAMICGSVSGSAIRPIPRAVKINRSSGMRWVSGRLLPASLIAVLAGVGVWGMAQTAAAAKLETALREVPVIEAWTDAADSHLCRTIHMLNEVLREVPDDAIGHATLGKLWVALYRCREFNRLQRQAPATARREVLWEQTSPRYLHGRVHRLARVKMDDALERLRGDGLVQETLAVALRHLLLARRYNPLLSDVHLLTAELSVLFADCGADEVYVQRLRHLGPGDPELLYRCGLLDFQAQRREAALASWRRSLTLSENRLADVVRWLGVDLQSAETVQKVFPPNPTLLIRLATNYFQSPDRARERANILAYAAESLNHLAIPDAQRHYLRGAVLLLDGRVAEAIAEYARAVQYNPNELAWRFELAQLLEAQGRWDEARREARLCVAVDPNRREYRELLHRISMAEAGLPIPMPPDRTPSRH